MFKERKNLRKVAAIAACLAVTTMFLGCKDKTNGNNGEPNNNGGCNLTASITPVSGFEKNEQAVNPQWKNKDGATVILSTDNAGGRTLEQFVTYQQGEYKKVFSDAAFDNTVKTTVAGRNAIEYTYTYSAYSIVMKARVVNLLECSNTKVYTITCSSLATTYESLANDFQSMIDSYTLK